MGSKFCIFVMFRKQNQETRFNKCFILLKINSGWCNSVLDRFDSRCFVATYIFYYFIFSSNCILIFVYSIKKDKKY